MQDQAFLGPGVRARGAGRGRRRGPLHRHPVAARRPRPARRLARPAAREGAARARRRRRRVRRPRGPLDAGPRLPARAPHRPSGEDDVRARGVVLRPHPPPPRADALRAPRHARRQARRRARADPARRRRLRVELDRGVLERRLVRVRALRRPERAASTPTSSTPTTRRAARCAASAPCRPASRTRRRWTSSPPRWRWTRSSCGGATRCATGSTLPTGATDPLPGAGRRAARRACAAMPEPEDAGGVPGGHRQRHPRRGRAARRRLRRRLQEHRLLRGLRRLLDRARAALARAAASRSSRSTPRPPRSARASSPCRSRSRAPSSASSGSSCCRPTRRSARPAPRRPRARR